MEPIGPKKPFGDIKKYIGMPTNEQEPWVQIRHLGLCTTIRKRSTVKQTLQITEARSAASFEKVERL